MVEGLKPWEFSNNKIVFGAEMAYIAPLLLDESAMEMFLRGQSSPEPWAGVLFWVSQL